jgi:hypothetical protein
MFPAAMPARSPDFLQFRVNFFLGTRRGAKHEFVKSFQHSLLLALAEPSDPLMIILYRLPDNLAFRFGQPRRGIVEAPDGRLVEREGDLGRCHTMTILPYRSDDD